MLFLYIIKIRISQNNICAVVWRVLVVRSSWSITLEINKWHLFKATNANPKVTVLRDLLQISTQVVTILTRDRKLNQIKREGNPRGFLSTITVGPIMRCQTSLCTSRHLRLLGAATSQRMCPAGMTTRSSTPHLHLLDKVINKVKLAHRDKSPIGGENI